MDREMIERVAKAILETPYDFDYKTLIAKNAIKAMREPTDKMISNATNSRPFVEQNLNSKVTWYAMIDSILND